MCAVKAGFNENEHRDGCWRWTAEDEVEVTIYDGSLTGIPTNENTSEALRNI